ncbi:MAG TPA: Crp/Fnr family transcriptional regulator [Candidatus Angelobacter sp.]
MNPITNSVSKGALGARQDLGKSSGFDAMKFLARAGLAGQPLKFSRKQVLFAEGTSADSVFYICSGRVKVAAVSNEGKEATIALLGPGDFAGDDCLADVHPVRTTTATAICDCGAYRIHRSAFLQGIQSEPTFLSFFLSFVMARKARMQEDLLHQLFSSSEQRLARLLLLLAGISPQDKAEARVPKISHEMLAEMVGTTRARITFFMNRFRKEGLIDYNTGARGELLVRSSLSSVVQAAKLCDRCGPEPEFGALPAAHAGSGSAQADLQR